MVPLLIGLAVAGKPDPAAVDQVLDALHRSAAEADAETYFGLYAPDAVFVGTDATERWDLPAFRDFAEPHFAEAPAWAYTPVEREVHFGPKGRTAWFLESLRHERYGVVRGSGVLRLDDDRWRITQYVLSFPIPNARAGDVIRIVAAEVDGGGPTLPTPFSAAQIRAAYRPGFATVHRITQGDEQHLERTSVVSATADTVTMQAQTVSDGASEPARTFQAAWTDLRDHAAFAASRTTWVDEVDVTVPAGSFVTRQYTVDNDDARIVFWFALDLPGPPVKMVTLNEGAEVYRMELVERGEDPGR